MLFAICMVLSLPITAFAAEDGFSEEKAASNCALACPIEVGTAADVGLQDANGKVDEYVQTNPSEDALSENRSEEAAQTKPSENRVESETSFAADGGAIAGIVNGSAISDRSESDSAPADGNTADFEADTQKQSFDEQPQDLFVAGIDGASVDRALPIDDASAGESIITEVNIENLFHYEVGDTPRETADPFEEEAHKYEIAYECWEEMENGDPVAFWYSDESKYTSSMTRITQFEEGKNYMYSIELEAKPGYAFADNCVVRINVRPQSIVIKTLNGLLIPAIDTIHPVTRKEIGTVEINNATLSFRDGDTPVFTGHVPDDAQYVLVFEEWRTDGEWTRSDEWFNDDDHHGSDKNIIAFDKNKTYHYNLYLKPTAQAGEDGWVFGPNTVLKINGNPVSYTYQNPEEYENGYRYSFGVATGITATFSQSQTQVINGAAVENVELDYYPGDTPQATATAAADQNKYDILYESWGKLEKTDETTTETVAYWYSDEDYHPTGYARLTAFEEDGTYQYCVRLKAKDGFTFGDDISADDITLNGKRLPDGSYVVVLDDGKSCIITYGPALRTIRLLEEIRLNGPSLEFVDGDEPRFTGSFNSPFYDIDHQRWEVEDNRGIGIASSETWNNNYEQLITNFEYGRTYNYGVYFNITDLGLEKGYRFDKSTKLYLNDEEIALVDDQVKVYSDGEEIQFENVLSMTPEAAWQKIDVIEINGATIAFTDGDKPVFTGRTPEGAPYIYQFECWETNDGAGVNSAEFFDHAYEKHITAFTRGETYQYILYLKAERGYYFADDTKIKINGTLYGYRLVNIDPSFDSTGKMSTFWAYTDLTMTPEETGDAPDYRIIEGANGIWTQNSGDALIFRANGEFSKFIGVKVDGTLLTSDQYTAVSGSTVVTLKRDYLSSLSAGKHTLTVVFGDGDCSTEFEIKSGAPHNHSYDAAWKYDETNHWHECLCGSRADEAAHSFLWIVDKEASSGEKGSKHEECRVCGYRKDATEIPAAGSSAKPGGAALPKTGDTADILLWIVLAFLNGITAVGAAFVGKKKSNG